MISVIDTVYNIKQHRIKNIQYILSSFPLNDVMIYLKDGLFTIDVELVNLRPSEATHRAAFINQHYFDSYSFSPARKLFRLIIKRNGHCLYTGQKIQGLHS